MRIPGTPFHDEGEYPVSAKSFCGTLNVNVDNPKLTDAEFRDMVRRTLPIVDFPRPEKKDAS